MIARLTRFLSRRASNARIRAVVVPRIRSTQTSMQPRPGLGRDAMKLAYLAALEGQA